MTIRPCQKSDFANVFRLLAQLWPDKQLDGTALKRVFECALESDSQVYICAVNDDDELAGFASLTIKNNLWQAGNLAHIDELIVDEKHRGRGLGTRLLNEIIAVAKNRNCTRVELDSAFHRDAAHKFYERYGFENRAYLFSKLLV